MALEQILKAQLQQAIHDYNFPFVSYDFVNKKELQHRSMREVEELIKHQLLADEIGEVKDGLSNVLYWGYARTGYRWTRITDFRDRVTTEKLRAAQRTFYNLALAGVRDISSLHLPQFSGLSFVSKIRMFLDPANYVVLDIQLLKLKREYEKTIFDSIVHEDQQTIRITRNNERGYELWCAFCRELAISEFMGSGLRAADIERGIFHLVGTGRMELAVRIVRSI